MNKKLLLVILVVVVALATFLIHRDRNSKPLEIDQTASLNDSEENMDQKNLQWENPPEMQIDKSKKYYATLKTSAGDMKFELYADKTPITVNNFVFLGRQNYYNNTKFHRIIKDFMIQGGDPTGLGIGDPGYKFDDEPFEGEYVRGTLAMANAGPNTNGSQFFVMHGDVQIQKNYVIFGKMIEGEKTLDKIANTPVGPNPLGEPSSPLENVLLNEVVIEEK